MSTPLQDGSSPGVEYHQAAADYANPLDKPFSLNLTRGKPAPEQ
ncbi:hypothetical protein AB0D04_18155 [Streptomyces sp. NPDC048483]